MNPSSSKAVSGYQHVLCIDGKGIIHGCEFLPKYSINKFFPCSFFQPQERKALEQLRDDFLKYSAAFPPHHLKHLFEDFHVFNARQLSFYFMKLTGTRGIHPAPNWNPYSATTVRFQNVIFLKPCTSFTVNKLSPAYFVSPVE